MIGIGGVEDAFNAIDTCGVNVLKPPERVHDPLGIRVENMKDDVNNILI